MQLSCFETKLPNLMLKTRPKQLLGSLLLDIALPAKTYYRLLALALVIKVVDKLVLSKLVKFSSLSNPIELCSNHFPSQLCKLEEIN
jgi:hypothetical protein